ncbi:YfaP family protein [Algiphilus sp.]|uniref:YfaP family protein n=1 Tax=Algiphilus sp. TaxID=1872431 RepID=UPI003C4C9FA8
MNTFRILGLTLGIFMLHACGGGGGGGGGGGDGGAPDPDNPNSVMQAIGAKVGNATGNLVEGDLPDPTPEAENPPTVATTRSSQTASNGSTAQVPLTFSSSSPIARILAKVSGSDSFLDIDVSGSETQSIMAEQAGTRFDSSTGLKLDPGDGANLEINLPPDILEGTFQLQFAVENEEGQVSQAGTANITIARLGTGDLQFSLTWDTNADIDLRVVEPNGNEIFFGNPSSSTGGMLDNDDINGIEPDGDPGPEAVENIFWETDAPIGIYTVSVDYFSGSPATNFTVTVSANGEIVDTISRSNFVQGSGIEAENLATYEVTE